MARAGRLGVDGFEAHGPPHESPAGHRTVGLTPERFSQSAGYFFVNTEL